MTKSLLQPVKTISDLRNRAQDDMRYERLAIVSARNLGGDIKTVQDAYRWLEVNALETTEEGVVDEINFCIDLV